MPVAVVQPGQEDKISLKSLEGAWVVLQGMSYGQKLTRSQSASKMSVEMKRGQKDLKGEMEMMQLKAAAIDFRTCIVDHNLEDASGRKLDFSNPMDLNNLLPRVGEEIAMHIDKLNNFEDDDELGNLGNASD